MGILDRRLIYFLTILPNLLVMLSCSVELRNTTTYSSPIYVHSDFRSCVTRDWALATPVAGMFVGVSRYGDLAKVYSTPAHRVGAVAFHSPFRMAANNSSNELREAVSLRVLVDSYRPSNMSKLINPSKAYAGGWGSSNKTVSLERIDEVLQSTLQSANQLHTEYGRTLMVLYVSAHGWIHSDGESYVIPSDGDSDDPSTWIPYKSIIDTAKQFVGEDLDAQRRALVVLDACQFKRNEHVQHKPIPAPPGVMVVRASAPGQYAWHFTSTTTASQTVGETTGYRITFPVIKPKGPEQGLKVQRAQSKMSVIPIAAGCELYDATEERKVFTLESWGEQIRLGSNSLLDKIPDIDRLELRQDIQIEYGEGTRDFPVFQRKEGT